MLSNGTMDEAARARVAMGSIGAPPPSPRVANTSGIELAKDRLGELHRMLAELDNHLEVQTVRLTGPFGVNDGCASQVNKPIAGGAVGELHDHIDGLFAIVNSIGTNAARLSQV